MKRSSLNIAVSKNKIKCVERMLSSRVNVNALDGNGYHSLIFAAYNNHYSMAKLLLDNGANVNLKTKEGDNPLYFCKTNAMVKLLLSYGATVDNKILFIAIGKEREIPLIDTLIKAGADVNVKSGTGVTLLHYVAHNVSDEKAEFFAKILLSHDANLNVQDDYGFTPLHIAAQKNKSELIKFFLDNNADVNLRGNFGSSVLHWAVLSCNISIVELLIKSGADPNAKDRNGQTPTNWGEQKEKKIIKYII